MSNQKKRTSRNQTFRYKWTLILVSLALIMLVTLYFLFFKKHSPFVKEGELRFLSKDSGKELAKIDVEAAIKPEEQRLGLMFREEMDDDEGMLFIYSYEERQSFWMANTLIPLDIAFIESKGKIDTIYRNTTPLDSTSLPSRKKIQFVVETNGGFSDKHGIKEGDLIEYKLVPGAN